MGTGSAFHHQGRAACVEDGEECGGGPLGRPSAFPCTAVTDQQGLRTAWGPAPQGSWGRGLGRPWHQAGRGGSCARGALGTPVQERPVKRSLSAHLPFQVPSGREAHGAVEEKHGSEPHQGECGSDRAAAHGLQPPARRPEGPRHPQQPPVGRGVGGRDAARGRRGRPEPHSRLAGPRRDRLLPLPRPLPFPGDH